MSALVLAYRESRTLRWLLPALAVSVLGLTLSTVLKPKPPVQGIVTVIESEIVIDKETPPEDLQ